MTKHEAQHPAKHAATSTPHTSVEVKVNEKQDVEGKVTVARDADGKTIKVKDVHPAGTLEDLARKPASDLPDHSKDGVTDPLAMPLEGKKKGKRDTTDRPFTLAEMAALVDGLAREHKLTGFRYSNAPPFVEETVQGTFQLRVGTNTKILKSGDFSEDDVATEFGELVELATAV